MVREREKRKREEENEKERWVRVVQEDRNRCANVKEILGYLTRGKKRGERELKQNRQASQCWNIFRHNGLLD